MEMELERMSQYSFPQSFGMWSEIAGRIGSSHGEFEFGGVAWFENFNFNNVKIMIICM